MAPDGSHHHRSTLKQKNKTFKSRHSTKSSIKKLAKGRPASVLSSASGASSASLSSSARAHAHNATARKNHAKQVQLAKREEIKKVEDMFTRGGVPKLVSVLELTPDAGADAWAVCAQLEKHKGVEMLQGYDVATALREGRESCRLRLARPTTTLQLMPLPYGSLYPALSAVASSDFVIFVLSATHSIEAGSWGELALRILHAQGMPEVLAVVPTLKTPDGPAGKIGENAVRKSLTSFVKYFAPSTDKIHALDVEAERDGLLRSLATSVPRFPSWRDARPYLVAEAAQFRPAAEDPSRGSLIVKGWTRGNAQFSAQRLVHVRDFGDFKVRRILDLGEAGEKRGNGRAQRRAPRAGTDVEMDDGEAGLPAATTPEGIPILEERDEEEADDSASENEVSEGAFGQEEQTWPTEEEVAEGEHRQLMAEKMEAMKEKMAAAAAAAPESKEDKYKTRWLIEESDDEGEGGDEDLEDMEEEDEGVLGDGGDDFPVAGPSTMAQDSVDEGDEGDDDAYDYDDGASDDDAALFEAQASARARDARAAEDLQFPDEVDTPMHISARQRFARYRGLASLRSSTWDAYEELPAEYAKIFQFDDWDRVRRAVEGKARLEGVQAGTHVGLEMEDVPREMALRFGAEGMPRSARLLPMTVWGLLRHEHKKTVMNFTVLRNTEYTETIKSKDPVLLLLGPRLLRVNPIYSEHSLGASGSVRQGPDGAVNVHAHKFHRFLPPPNPAPSVGTIYAPITFGCPSVTLLRPRSWASAAGDADADGEHGYDERGVGATQYPELIGSGNVLKRNGHGPLRCAVKRVVLTGEPFKIHRRTATIRWMFFQPEDVRYFKPVPLRTKYGRTGHISEPLGTHGRFKAHFDGPIGQMDTIMMALYKRVFPKYTTRGYTQGWEELPVRLLEGTEGRGAGAGAAEDTMDM